MSDQELDELAFKFFKLFAQYESSLKEHGYFQSDARGRIRVDWDRYANEIIGPDFMNDLGDKSEAAEYILKSPPMKQVVDENRRIIWKEVSNTDKSIPILFTHIRRMRNNLFHGAKFNGTWFDPDRSKQLLERGLIVLEHFRSRL